MLRIHCPFCGARDHHEFTYGGDAGVERPAFDDESQAQWYRYVFERTNPAGAIDEFWQHTLGCRAWLIVTRDTRDHAIHAARLARADAEVKSDG